MTSSILMIIDPLSQLKVSKDSSLHMAYHLWQQSYPVYLCQASDLSVANQQVHAQAQRIEHFEQLHSMPTLAATTTVTLQQDFTVLVRKDPPVDSSYLTMTHLLDLAQAHGATIINRPQALRDGNEKLLTLQFADDIPETHVSSDPQAILQFVATHQHAVIKPLHLMGGQGIFKLTMHDPNLPSLIQQATASGQATVIVQRYLPEIMLDGDLRVVIFSGQACPWALKRMPAANDFRGNMAAGGSTTTVALSPAQQQRFNHLGQQLLAQGIYLAGIDVIGEYLTEINITSPTGIQELNTTHKNCLTSAIVELTQH